MVAVLPGRMNFEPLALEGRKDIKKSDSLLLWMMAHSCKRREFQQDVRQVFVLIL
jgi:hypothetical protein